MAGRSGTDRATIATVLVIGALWGLNWPAVKLMLTEIPPLTVRACAFPLAGVALALLARARGERLRPARGELLPILWTGLPLVLGFNGLTSIGQTLTETSRAAILAYTMPAMTAGLAAIFLGERAGKKLWLALGLGMAGLAALASENLSALLADPLGPAVMLAAALSWAAGGVLFRAQTWSLSPLALTAWFFAVSTIGGWLLVFALEAPFERPFPSPRILAVFGFHVAGPMVAAYALWTALVARVGATTGALATLAAPVVGVLSSMLLLGDPASPQKFLALALIVASVAVTLAPRKA